MYVVTRVYHRPNIDIPWHGEILVTDLVKQRLESYVNSGKLIEETKTFSEDGLTFTYVGKWLDQESFEIYDTDPELQEFWNDRIVYCDIVGITVGPKVFTIE